MTALTGTRRGLSAIGSACLLAVLLLTATACQPDAAAVAGKRTEVRWAERQWLFVADGQTGSVRVFHTRAAPLLLGELRAPGRTAVRDIRVDEARGRIWVLDGAAVYLHDARSWSLIRRIPTPAVAASRLELEASGAPRLQAADGTPLARIEAAGFSIERVGFSGY